MKDVKRINDQAKNQHCWAAFAKVTVKSSFLEVFSVIKIYKNCSFSAFALIFVTQFKMLNK